MSSKSFSPLVISGSLAAIAATMLLVVPAEAQVQRSVKTSSSTKNWTPMRTPDGQPDLQGIWTNATLTPLERPSELAGKQALTQAEAAAYEKQLIEQGNRDRRDGNAEIDAGRAYNEFWFDRGTKVVGSRRTSLIVDPPDGRLPPLTPEAQKRDDRGNMKGFPELALHTRCITGYWQGGGP